MPVTIAISRTLMLMTKLLQWMFRMEPKVLFALASLLSTTLSILASYVIMHPRFDGDAGWVVLFLWHGLMENFSLL